MKVNSIELNNFRNISHIFLEADEGVNVIYGENAQGKTNILEATWLFTGCKSFRGAKDNEFIKFNEDITRITLNFQDKVREKKSEIVFSGQKKNVFHNGVQLPSSSKLNSSFYSVIFSPAHLSLIKDGPSQRRKFLDTAICQLKPSYTENLTGFKRSLLQRNALLKDIHLNTELYDVLDALDLQLATYGSSVIFERIKYINVLSEYAKEIYGGISENREKFSMSYSEKGFDIKNPDLNEISSFLYEKIKSSRKEDIITKSTSVGPHRDDIEILLNRVSARSFGSQGQQRSCALALKLGESEIIKNITGETPVALHADVMSELDEKRQDYVLNHINDRQVFLTCCDPSQVLRLCGGKSFLIKGGEIV